MFTGAEVDGDSGFVNLMRMKRAYFQSIRPKLMEETDRRAERDSLFREELFDKLYTFFHRYFCESGSIYFRHLPVFSKTYERVYADGRDVALSWKTQMLYYVKSDVLVRSMPVELNEQDKPQNTRRFFFDATEIEHKKNNERREFVFTFDQVKRDNTGRVVHLKATYSHKGNSTKIDHIIKASRAAGVRITEQELQKAIGVFRRQTEADFFINKDARGFLREQFDLWMYQYLFQEETIFQQKRIEQLQAIKELAYCIIDFVAQFEDELRRVWEKPKFVRNVNYVITLDKLPDSVLEKITKHNGAKAQISEWRELGMVDEKFSMRKIFNGQKNISDKNRAGEHRFLPLDTKHFKNLELEILDGLGNLDEALDGELVHSENWQALNTLQRRYKGKVKCIYIDPPYNAQSSEIAYVNTYKHASWISLMADRLRIGKLISGSNAPHVIAIDEVEQEFLGQIISQEFTEWRKVCVPIVHNPRGQQGKNISYVHEYAFFVYPNDNQKYIADILKDEVDSRNLRDSGTESNRHSAASCFYPFIVKDRKLIGVGEVPSDNIHPASANVAKENGVVEIWPIDEAGNEKKWRYSVATVHKILEDLEIKNGRKSLQVIFNKEKETMRSLWVDSKYDASEYGTKVLQSILGKNLDSSFKYPKSIHTIQRILLTIYNEDKEGTVLDYFAGSGTTAHAVINLNREHGGNRKYLLIEMGEYFYTVLLPRIKKVVYSKDWKEGKPVSREGGSHFLKYYTLEQYEETLKNARYEDGEQLELDSIKSPFEQYVFFGDDKLAHFVKPLKNGKLNINLHNLYPDIDIAETLSNALGKPIRKRTADTVTFADGSTEKINPKTMTKPEQRHFVSLIKSYLWWGE